VQVLDHIIVAAGASVSIELSGGRNAPRRLEDPKA
jgi:hypothetical protein